MALICLNIHKCKSLNWIILYFSADFKDLKWIEFLRPNADGITHSYITDESTCSSNIISVNCICCVWICELHQLCSKPITSLLCWVLGCRLPRLWTWNLMKLTSTNHSLTILWSSLENLILKMNWWNSLKLMTGKSHSFYVKTIMIRLTLELNTG